MGLGRIRCLVTNYVARNMAGTVVVRLRLSVGGSGKMWLAGRYMRSVQLLNSAIVIMGLLTEKFLILLLRVLTWLVSLKFGATGQLRRCSVDLHSFTWTTLLVQPMLVVVIVTWIRLGFGLGAGDLMMCSVLQFFG